MTVCRCTLKLHFIFSLGGMSMLGAIVGDIVGSTYEFHPADRYDFELFPKGSAYTDDTVGFDNLKLTRADPRKLTTLS